ncbi:MAPEG family protein [Glaciecola siphonariae]|uniref:MAPEG family protein n=1 Tax=Glaciecola siphonariae TaxID=521012 RepID=A0ABV9LRS8_9ALTE
MQPTDTMNFTITTTYAVFLVALLIILTFRVIDLRGSPATKWLHGKGRKVSDEQLQRAIRGHGNLCEYLPVFLIMLMLGEVNGLAVEALHACGISFTLGRYMHGLGFGFVGFSPVLRIGGMVFTLLAMMGMFAGLCYVLLAA